MKRCFALLAIVLVVAGCFGTRSRTDVLLPAIEVAWPQVRVEAIRGGLPEVTADNFGAALQDGDATTVTATWPAVQSAAEADIRNRIDAGLVSAGVASSLYERLKNIDEAVELLKQRPP